MTDKLNCIVQSCFETFVGKYLNLSELKNFYAFRFFALLILGEPKKTERANFCVFEIVLFVNKALRISQFYLSIILIEAHIT